MSREMLVAISVVFVIVVFVTAWLGWRSRAKRQTDIAPFTTLDALQAHIDAPILFVAVTRAGKPYERITVHGMGFRARGRIAIGEAGALLDLPKANVLIPAASITAVERATWTIDRVVESKGLIRITWTHEGVPLDVNIRVTDDDHDIFQALANFVPALSTPTDATGTTKGTDA